MLSIKFHMENAAFQDDPDGETVRILRGIIGKIQAAGSFGACGACMDINGNKIGQWFYDPPEQEENEDEEEGE